MHKQRGVSMVEVLISVVLVAVIGTFAVPNYLAFMRNKAITAYASVLSDNLALAQSEAQQLNLAVTVCARGANNSTVCDPGNNWNNGYLVASLDSSGNIVTVLAAQAAPQNALTFTTPQQAPLIINPNGSIKGSNNFTIDAPGCTGNNQLTVSINTASNITTTASACD